MMPHHPWARYITPHPEWPNLSDDNVTSALPKNVYAHLGNGGYLATRFVKSLFPRKFRGVPSGKSKLPIMEIMRMEHAIDFRRHADDLIDQVVAKNRGQLVIVEAKDFFVPGPDHHELHCIVLDQYAVNLQSNTRGFDVWQLSVKDFL
ncbi:hypothetical protein ANCCAN_16730 [Ancylostoma caninum]|uniref:Uncharacterized protein n=1 Tax=Ancylostoma caninum TaxID=29170 RepID=A0A368FYV3_ANCCA|nr:hypothetical protein ANCCAN_16730 [Ancylostoma caninum]